MQKCGLRGPFRDEALTRREATAGLVRVPRLLHGRHGADDRLLRSC
jgi:hypothetical protein